MTTIYFMRHSEALKTNNIENNDSLQLQNEKWVLTENGENIAKKRSKAEELKNFDKNLELTLKEYTKIEKISK